MRAMLLAIFLYSFTTLASAQACTVSSSPVAFGNYNSFSSTATDTTGSVTVTCSALVALLVGYTIRLDGGLSGSVSARRMSSGVSNLFYQLYTNTARTTLWGDGTAGSSTISDGYLLSVGVAVVKTFPVYGRITALQNVAFGSYTDTVTILLTY